MTTSTRSTDIESAASTVTVTPHDANTRILLEYLLNSTKSSVIQESHRSSASANVHNIENCTSPLDNVNFEDARILGSLAPLGLVCLMVILGNIMVITAVRITHKLRGATNLFIVSLAWADLMLGIVVLPFSAMYEVFKMWLFGKVW